MTENTQLILDKFYEYFDVAHAIYRPPPQIHVDPMTQQLDVWGTSTITQIKRSAQFPIQFGFVEGDFRATHADLTTLKGAPEQVKGDFSVHYNQLQDLTHAPKQVGGHLFVNNNPLKSLSGIPDQIEGTIYISYKTRLPLLRCLVPQQGVQFVTNKRTPQIREVETILNKYKGQGRSGAIKCAIELIRAGYKENAKW